MTHNSNDKLISFFIEFIKQELDKPEFKNKFIKPLIIQILFYIIPIMVIFLLFNFITTFFAIFLFFNFKITKNYILY